MITFIAHLRVKPENSAALEALLTYVAEMTRKHEPGVPYYAFAKRVDEPNTYVVIEVYKDRHAHAAHMASAWVKESLPKAARLIEGSFDIKQYVTPGCEPAVRQAEDFARPPS